MDFKTILIAWYKQHARELPWRNTTNPYYIWVSEIILQQTRVAQGLGYYNRFIKAFPTINDLARANEDEVLKQWQGLGYYSRARNLHAAARHLVSVNSGKLPSTYNELLAIKGIGAYSAGAIASFAFKIPVPAIDGNVYRIIARIFGVFSSPDNSKGKKEFYEIVSELIDPNSPDVFNQALLDFGAIQCVPRNPKCENCPFAEYCYAYRNNMIESLPVKGKRIVPVPRYFTYILIRYKDYTFISKRQKNDIWKSLYEFPLIESSKIISVDEVSKTSEWNGLFGDSNVNISYVSPIVKHQLSHQTIFTQFLVAEIYALTIYLANNYIKIPVVELDCYTIPKLIDNFLVAEPAAKYFLNKPE